MRIFLLIRSLGTGGAEQQLIVLANGLASAGHDVTVAVFYGGGALENYLDTARVQLVNLDKRGRYDVVHFILHLRRVLRDRAPMILFCSLPGASLVGLIGRLFFQRPRIVWRLASTWVDYSALDTLSTMTYRVQPWLAHLTDSVVVNSRLGMSHAARQGFPKKRLRLIQNGISTDRFHRNEEARMQLRTAWDINENQCLIGLVARIDPLKDHEVFLQAASLSARRCSDMRFVCIGSGDAELLNKLKEQAAMLGLDSVLQWVDEYSDPVAIYNALDINTLVSKSEGFPNVVAEAMACGTPCVVTDVGDSREIVGETGKVCPSGSSEAVSEAWMQMRDHVKVYRERIADDCRNRVIQKFSQQQMVERHIQLFEQLV